jgi:hypothetical protein
MKDTIQHKQAQERMRPGAITAQGFLGQDGRAVAEIVEADEAEFRALGLEFEEVASALEALRDEAEKGLGEPVAARGGWEVQTGDVRGKLPCPFGDGIHHKNSVSARHAGSQEFITFSDLSIHLLRAHHFCQGRGSPYRLEPEALARLLS